MLSQFGALGAAAGVLTAVFEYLRERLTEVCGAVNSRTGRVVTPLLAGAACSVLAMTGRHQSLAQSMALMNRMVSGDVSGTATYGSFVVERLFAVSLCATSGLLGECNYPLNRLTHVDEFL